MFEKFHARYAAEAARRSYQSPSDSDDGDIDDGDNIYTRMPGGSFKRKRSSDSGGGGGSGGRHKKKQRQKQKQPGASAPPPAATSEFTRPLALSLEELYAGATKHLKVGRRLLSGRTEEKVLEIAVLPGWKSGTKIRFPRAGNEVSSNRGETQSQELVFVVEEKPHARFERSDSDLIIKERVSLVDALLNTGGTRTVHHLDGRRITVSLPTGVIKPGTESRVAGEGMPIRKEGAMRRKGDLVVRWEVDFPDWLSAAQKEGVKKALG